MPARSSTDPPATRCCRYYAGLAWSIRNCKEHSGIWHLPDPLAVYPAEVQVRLSQHLEDASDAARNASPEVRERIKQEKDVWALAVQTVSELHSQAAAKTVKQVHFDGSQYAVEQDKGTGRFLRNLFGILGDQTLILIDGEQEREIGMDEELPIVDGMKFRLAR